MKLPQHTSKTRRLVLGLVFTFLAYACADLFLNKVAIGGGWMILWPLNGVTIALLLRNPRHRWPLLLLSIELGTLLGEGLDTGEWKLKLLERGWSLAEVLIAAYLLPAFVSMEDWLAQPRIVRRVGAALTLGPGISGLLYAAQYYSYFHAPFVEGWNTWATPDMLGIAVTMPVALAFLTPETAALFSHGRWPKTILLLLGSAAVAVLIFSEGSYPLLFLLYPMLLYVDSELSFTGASIATFTSAVVGVYCTVHGHGPFGHWSPELRVPRDASLQIYLGFHALALLPLSLVILERRNIATQLRTANAQLIALSRQDALTGIANRRAFDEGFEAAWNCALAAETKLSVLMIDIDRFKQYNDTYGHVTGDRCLARVAEVLARVGRTPRTLVARFGGEEFAVLVEGTSSNCCTLEAEALRQAVFAAAIPHESNPGGVVTISVGCATAAPVQGAERVDLLQCADSALYRAKQRGRNQWACAEEAFAGERVPLHALLDSAGAVPA